VCYQSGDETPDGTRLAGSWVVAPSLDIAQSLARDVMEQSGESLRRRKELEAGVQKNDKFDVEDQVRLPLILLRVIVDFKCIAVRLHSCGMLVFLSFFFCRWI
jgi:hypothetical protein